MKAMTEMPATIDAYLAGLPKDVAAALDKLRTTIKAAAPGATEAISYRIPTFSLHGKLVGFAAFEKHCGFYLMSTGITETYKADIAPYLSGKGTLHFTPTEPLPTALVKKLVKARIAENLALIAKHHAPKTK